MDGKGPMFQSVHAVAREVIERSFEREVIRAIMVLYCTVMERWQFKCNMSRNGSWHRERVLARRGLLLFSRWLASTVPFDNITCSATLHKTSGPSKDRSTEDPYLYSLIRIGLVYI